MMPQMLNAHLHAAALDLVTVAVAACTARVCVVMGLLRNVGATFVVHEAQR